jgi:ATP-dependent Clp protease ATP-binding subunit ClpC
MPFNMLLQILEDGRLTDAKGRTVDFKNTLLIMTSNIGSKVIEKGGGGLGFEFEQNQAESQYNRIRSLVNEELKQYFRPEFLNRLDEIHCLPPAHQGRGQGNRRNPVEGSLCPPDGKTHPSPGYRTLQGALGGGRLQPQLRGSSPAAGRSCACWRTPWRRKFSGRLVDGDTATVDVDDTGKVTIQAEHRRELVGAES